MDYSQAESILMEIFKEQQTIAKFMDIIFQFLLRRTNFRMMDASKRTRLWQLFLDELSPYEAELQTHDSNMPEARAGRIAVDITPAAASEIEIEISGSEVELEANMLITNVIANKTNNMDVTSKMQIVPSTNQVCGESTNHPQRLKKFRKILPKKEEAIQSSSDVKQPSKKTSTKRLYKCSECTEIFASFRQLKVHESLHTSQADDGISVCVYCCSLYANAETLEKHITEYHGNGRYQCVPCGKTYKNRGHLLKHAHSSTHNAKALLYYCSLCPRAGKSYIEFSSRSALQQHYQKMHLLMPASADEDDDVELEMNEEFLDEFLLNNVNENSFNFSECWDALDLNLPDMLRLTNAEDVETTSNAGKCEAGQGNDTLFKCPNCSEGCSTQKLLLQHFAHKHELPTLICNKCDASFTDYAPFIHHKSSHRTQFEAARNPPRNLLQCEICDKVLRSTAALNYHIKTHLRSFVQDPPHKCIYCHKHFHAHINLKQHILIVHSHIKRHLCELCDKPFATLDHLKKHVLSQHQNERKHLCGMCDKSFTQLCHLKQHLAIHTTGKPHKCVKCEGKFWRKIDLRRHMLKRHA